MQKLRTFSPPVRRITELVAVALVASSATAFAAGVIAPRDSVTSASVRNDSLYGYDVKNGALGTADLRDGSVLGRDIAGGAIGSGQLADGAVGTSKLADGSVGTAEIGAGSVTRATIDPTLDAPAITERRRGIHLDVAAGSNVVSPILSFTQPAGGFARILVTAQSADCTSGVNGGHFTLKSGVFQEIVALFPGTKTVELLVPPVSTATLRTVTAETSCQAASSFDLDVDVVTHR